MLNMPYWYYSQKQFPDTIWKNLVRSRLEYACCVWQQFYSVHIARIERIQEKFIKYALRRLGWDANSDLPPYRSRCALINLDTLQTRREIARILLVFDILSGKVSPPPLLAEVDLRVPSYPTRRREFFHIVIIARIMAHLTLWTLLCTASMRSLTFSILICRGVDLWLN
jgi:hypothetical protein